MNPEYAEILALEGLGWLAQDGDSIQKFLNLSGMDVADLRAAAGDPATCAAILDFLLADEPLLIKFCEAADVQPQKIASARRALGGMSE